MTNIFDTIAAKMQVKSVRKKHAHMPRTVNPSATHALARDCVAATGVRDYGSRRRVYISPAYGWRTAVYYYRLPDV